MCCGCGVGVHGECLYFEEMNDIFCPLIWFSALSHFIIMHFMTGCAFLNHFEA